MQGLALGHHRRGLGVEVAAILGPDEDDHPFLHPLQEAGVPTHRLHVAPRAYLSERREVKKVLLQSSPDVVHTHGNRPDVLHSPTARKMGLATVTTVHGSSRPSWRSGPYEWLQFRLLRRVDAVIAVSRPLVMDLMKAGVPKDRIWMLPNAWDGRCQPMDGGEARDALGLPHDAFVFGWVGRLIPVKGADIFLRALASLGETSRAYKASLIGDGRELIRLKRLADRLAIRDQVSFHGRVPDAARYFSAFDAFVLSSRSEGTPMVLFEAMAARTPIIAAKVGGVPDVVSDSEALLVTPEDPGDLTAVLRQTLDQRNDLSGLAARARERLETSFGTEAWLKSHERVYRTVASSVAGT